MQQHHSSGHILRGSKHIWLPYAQMQNHLPQLEVEEAKGAKIFLKNGAVLIDGIASWWSVAHGYQHPHIVKALTKQAKKLSHIMLAGCANDATYELAHRLCRFAKMDRVFFSDSGSTAVEVAMKMAWQFWINSGEKQKTKFISFKNSYHGDTTGAMSLADLTSGMHKKFEKILLKNFSVTLPQNEKEFATFQKFVEKNKKILAGIFIEPLIQCAGGMRFHSAETLRKIHQIAQKNNLLFITDECAVGFYRTGTKFACDAAKITPDILILGKALTGGFTTLAATLTSEKIFKKFLGKSLDSALMHGPTFMGNALACAAANASLDLFERVDYAKKIAADEKFLRRELEKCLSLKNVRDVRVVGLIGVVELNYAPEKIWQRILELRQKFITDGIFLRPFGNCVYLMPALNIKRADLKKITDSIFKTLSNLK